MIYDICAHITCTAYTRNLAQIVEEVRVPAPPSLFTILAEHTQFTLLMAIPKNKIFDPAGDRLPELYRNGFQTIL